MSVLMWMLDTWQKLALIRTIHQHDCVNPNFFRLEFATFDVTVLLPLKSVAKLELSFSYILLLLIASS